jgi:hypothetical protein
MLAASVFSSESNTGRTDRMALLLDDTFEMLVMAQNDKPLHGVETIDVSIFSITISQYS